MLDGQKLNGTANDNSNSNMDLLGDIVEHNVQPAQPPAPPQPPAQRTTTLERKPQAKTPSRWRQRLQEKGITSMSGVVEKPTVRAATPATPPVDDGKFYTVDEKTQLKTFKDKGDRRLNYEGLSETEQIHQENIEILSRMSADEREQTKQELLDSFDPKVLQMLMNRSAKKYGAPEPLSTGEPQSQSTSPLTNDPIYQPVEGSLGTWVGGEHELDKEQSGDVGGDSTSNTTSTRSSVSGSLKSALKHTSDTSSGGKKIRFSKESKVIYLDQNEKVSKSKSSSSSHSDQDPEAEWEDVEDLQETSPSSSPSPSPSPSPTVIATPDISPPANIDEDAAPSYEEAKALEEHDDHSHAGIHFPKPTQPYEELDINDPKFNDKLYEKYFPDLPKNPKQLEWMKPVSSDDVPLEIEYDSLESVRFDFMGNIITNENVQRYVGENQGLFNHSENPELPGYTLSELAHYLRSTFPGQVCIACRTLGRIIYKLGTLKYQVQEQDDEDHNNINVNNSGNEGLFEIECWKLLSKLRVVELLQKYASDKERNLSVKNYAIDALWLWKKCNGDEKMKKFAVDESEDENREPARNLSH